MDFKFITYLVATILIDLLILGSLVIAIFFSKSASLITILPFNTIIDGTMILSLAYLGVNMIEKWLTDYRAPETAIDDGTFSRKKITWFHAIGFVIGVVALLAILYFVNGEVFTKLNVDLSKLVFMLVWITSFFQVAKATNDTLKQLKPPFLK